FLNRLQRTMPLQADPTIIYALGRRFDGNLTRAHLDLDSPYNTYLHSGLPPTPIANPGRASIEAVLRPADVEDLYFVAKPDRSHHFSATLRDHERAVRRYQRRGR
ncbi:MAG: endolytic transglycosylase MltG, partial [bacterium]